MSEEDRKLQKHLVDEMMKVSETNPDVMFYMKVLMKKNEGLEQKVEQQEKEIDRLNNIIKELSKDVDMWNKKYNEQFNIITELEKWLEDKQNLTCGCGITVDYLFAYENCLDKLKELKENK